MSSNNLTLDTSVTGVQVATLSDHAYPVSSKDLGGTKFHKTNFHKTNMPIYLQRCAITVQVNVARVVSGHDAPGFRVA